MRNLHVEYNTDIWEGDLLMKERRGSALEGWTGQVSPVVCHTMVGRGGMGRENA